MSEDKENPTVDEAPDTKTDLSAEDDQSAADDWAAALEEQQDEERHQEEKKTGGAGPNLRQPEWLGGGNDASAATPMQPEEFANLASSGSDTVNLDMVLDVPVTISMEIGRTRIPIRNLLQLNQGSVVELDRLAGEPLNVLVNGTLIAHGEVVVVNEKFGIRLTDVISPSERIRKINK